MALKKQIVSEKGICTNYHRIEHISMIDNIKVIVKSYTDESYRCKEKECEQKMKKQQEIQKKLQDEMYKTGDEYRKEKVIALTEENNQIGFPVMLDFSVFIREFEYPLDKETAVSYGAMYERLKREPMFHGANDVLE